MVIWQIENNIVANKTQPQGLKIPQDKSFKINYWKKK